VGGGRFSGTFYLYDAPAVAHLDEDERPRFAFFNHMRGIDEDTGDDGPGDDAGDGPGGSTGGDGSRAGRSDGDETGAGGIPADGPDTNGIALVLVTGRRALALVGREDGDRTLSLHYDVVTDVTYETGNLHHRIVVGTAEAEYTLWVSRQFDEAALGRAVSFVRDRMVDPDVILDRAEANGSDGAPDGGSVASDGGPSGDATGTETGDQWDAVPSTDPTGGPLDAVDPGEVGPDGGSSGEPDPGAGTSKSTDQGADPPGVAGPDGDPSGDPNSGGDPSAGSDRGTEDPDTAPKDGSELASGGQDPLAQIERLHSLKEAGAISAAEYEEKKDELLDRV